MKTRITCPICDSGDFFDFAKISQSVDCEDCGFPLIEKESLSKDKLENIHNCILCNCNRFHHEACYFNFLTSKSIYCYVCEAEYWDWKPKYVDDSFNLKSYRLAKKSETILDWKNRIKLYLEQSP